MNRIKNFWLTLAAVVMLSGGIVLADPITMTPDPVGGAISGAPGTTIGWGFTLTNSDPTNYVVPIGSIFCVGPVSSSCTVAVGTYTDIISGSVLQVAPAGTVTQTFDPGTPSGWGSFTLNSNVAPGTVIAGTLVMFYDLYDSDLTNGGVQIPGSHEFDAAASITVNSPAVVPEPSSLLLLLGTGLAALTRLMRRRLRAHPFK